MPPESQKRRVCFVTGTRAEFGLMRSTLNAIRAHPKLELQIIATGMHLSSAHGRTADSIKSAGWPLDAIVPWSNRNPNESNNAIQTGRAMAGIAAQLDRLKTDIVLVVGDRVEPFAAAAAAHITGKIIAHIHGGDRALGQVDDSLRHAITKLAHIHFPATPASASRIRKLGEDNWRIHTVGSPGIDGIANQAAPEFNAGRYALLVLHPTETNEQAEYRRADLLLKAIRKIGFDQIVIVYPNNDPGSAGIIRRWQNATDCIIHRDVARPKYLALLRDAAVLTGNSSSGIIEAASFGTPVLDIGPRQSGRQRSQNVKNIPFTHPAITKELRQIWNNGNPIRFPKKNVYGGHATGQRIASILSKLALDSRLKRKLIAY